MWVTPALQSYTKLQPFSTTYVNWKSVIFKQKNDEHLIKNDL